MAPSGKHEESPGLLNYPATPHCSEEESKETHGHITSLAVARTHRKLGLATRLMTAARELLCRVRGVDGMLGRGAGAALGLPR